MYNEVTFKKTEIVSVSKDGTASVAVHLEGKPSAEFSEWFRNPSSYTWKSNFIPKMCQVRGNEIVFQAPDYTVKDYEPVLKEWIVKANEFARQKQQEREKQAEREQQERADAEKRRKSLQERVNKS
jgi:alpha-galactosidase/6-phospho-beta-glucosidase family protein